MAWHEAYCGTCGKDTEQTMEEYLSGRKHYHCVECGNSYDDLSDAVPDPWDEAYKKWRAENGPHAILPIDWKPPNGAT